jgi:hypothetical protein
MKGPALTVAIAVAIAPAIVRGEPEPATWLGAEEVIGGFRAGDPWLAWGPGLSLRRRVSRHLELGVDGELLRLQDDRDHSLGHGFAARIAAEVGVPLSLGITGREIAWLAIPEVGADTMAMSGLGPARVADDEVFVGVRLAARTTGWVQRKLAGRAFGLHLETRVGRLQGGYGGTALLGFDWGW